MRYLTEKFIPEKRQEIEAGKIITATLSEIFNAPEQFKAYPNVKNITVQFKTLPRGTAGMLHGDSNTISLDPILLNLERAKGGDKQALKHTLIHEIQHYIQGVEGFAAGGSFSTGTELNDKNAYKNGRFNRSYFVAQNLERKANVIFDNLSKETAG